MAYDIEKIRRDNAILRKYAIIQKAQEERVCVQTAYIDMTQDLEAALVLDELIFFTLPRDGGKSGLRIWKDGVLWMAVQRSDWWKRKRLKPRQADLAIKKLEEQELVFTSVHKFKGVNTVHIRLNVEKFFQRLAELLEEQNPPESEENTVELDIADLYEMMGASRLPNGDLESSRLQNGNERLPNGEIINIPNSNPNINNPTHDSKILSAEEKQKILNNADPAWSLSADVELTQETIDKNRIEEESKIAFERDMMFGALPWSSTRAWEKFENFVVQEFQKDNLIFAKYKTWQQNEGKFQAMSNRKIKERPEDFIACWPDFLAHSAMYGKKSEPRAVDTDENGIPMSY